MRGFKSRTALPTTHLKKLLKITHYSPSTPVDLVTWDKTCCAGWGCDLHPTSPCRALRRAADGPGSCGRRGMLRGCGELPPSRALQHPQTGVCPPELLETQSAELPRPGLCDCPVSAHSSPPSPAARCHAGCARAQHHAARLSCATTGTTANVSKAKPKGVGQAVCKQSSSSPKDVACPLPATEETQAPLPVPNQG